MAINTLPTLDVEMFRAGTSQLQYLGFELKDLSISPACLRVTACRPGFRVDYTATAGQTDVALTLVAHSTGGDPPIRCRSVYPGHTELYSAIRTVMGVAVARANALWAYALELPPTIQMSTERTSLVQARLPGHLTPPIAPGAPAGTPGYDIELDIIETMGLDGWEVCRLGPTFQCSKVLSLIDGDPFSGFLRAMLTINVSTSPWEMNAPAFSMTFVDPYGQCSGIDGYVLSAYGDLWQCLALVNASIRGARKDLMAIHHSEKVGPEHMLKLREEILAVSEYLDTCGIADIISVSLGRTPAVEYKLGSGDQQVKIRCQYVYGSGWVSGNYNTSRPVPDLMAWAVSCVKSYKDEVGK